MRDGVQALRTIRATRPDVAILDIGMPGLRSYEVARQVRVVSGRDDTVLIALTRCSGELGRSSSDEVRFDAHPSMPDGLDGWNRLIKRLCDVFLAAEFFSL